MTYTKHPVEMRTSSLAFAVIVLASGCCATRGPYTDHRPWLLCASRSFFGGEIRASAPTTGSSEGRGMSGTQPAAAFVFFALPIAFDVVFLPVAVTHDATYVW